MKCKVCGRGPRKYDGLCFGVHANCGKFLEIEDVTIVHRVWDARKPSKVWYTNDTGMKVIKKPTTTKWP